jgi:hypothetical protein
LLARIARADEKLLYPIEHGTEDMQLDLLQIKLRDNLVRQRVAIISSVRFTLKSLGIKLRSPNTDKQLRISKAGDSYMRRLLVNAAQYILGPFGPDCDLRRQGLKLAERGGSRAKKKAAIAIARKLSVLMLALWYDEELYEPNLGLV